MKRSIRVLLASLICLVFCATLVQPGHSAPSYKAGDVVTIGSYPQTRVTDSSLISRLQNTSASLSWSNYPYYSKNTGSNSGSNYYPAVKNTTMMKYKDFSLDGEKYRAVYISKARPRTADSLPNEDSTQVINGYANNQTYFFKWEPLKWIVLNPSDGFVIAQSALDSQPFNAYTYVDSTSREWNGWSTSRAKTAYIPSSIRQWLNARTNYDSAYRSFNFLKTAFSSNEQDAIKSTAITFSGESISDKIYLLSKDEFDSYKSHLSGWKATDYCLSQGSLGSSAYFLRTAYNDTRLYYATSNNYSGYSSLNHYDPQSTITCIRPVMKVNLSSSYVKPVQEIQYTLTGISASATTVSADSIGDYYLPDCSLNLTWKDGKAPGSYSQSGEYFYTDPSCASGTHLKTAPEAGKTYYVEVVIMNPTENDHSYDFSQVKKSDCTLTLPGFTTECYKVATTVNALTDKISVIFKVVKAPYVLEKVAGSSTGVEPYSFYYIVKNYEPEFSWRDGKKPENFDVTIAYLYEDAACTTHLEAAPSASGTYYTNLIIWNKSKNDHSLDFSQIKKGDCTLNLPDYTAECYSVRSYVDSLRGGDALEVVFKLKKQPDAYKLWVGGVKVTSANLSGPGWSYNPESSTLTLENATIFGAKDHAVAQYTEGINYEGGYDGHLTIVLKGKNTVIGTDASAFSYGIYCEGTLTITGEGNLDVKGGKGGTGNYAIEASKVIIDSGFISALSHESGEESYGISGNVTINNGGVLAIGYSAAFKSEPQLNGSINPGVAVSSVYNNISETEYWDRATPLNSYKTVLINAAANFVPPTITTASLPDGSVGKEYSQTLAATGNTPVYWSISSGSLPGGLTLSADGKIYGTPTAAGSYTFTVKASNYGGIGTREFGITVKDVPKTLERIIVTKKPNKTTYASGESFDRTGMVVTAVYSDESTAPVSSYTVSPDGPLHAGETNIVKHILISYTEGSVTKTDKVSVSVLGPKKLLNITITKAPAKTSYTAGESFDKTGMVVTAFYTDGSSATVSTYTVSPSGPLNTGDTNAIISFTEGGITVTAKQPITVKAAAVKPSITTASLPAGTVGTAYSQSLAATGDKTITWSVSSGALPKGLSLSADGKITGTPTAAGKATFTVKASNGAGSATRELSISVNAVKPVYKPGDINGDGKVNIFDVIRLLKKVTGEDVKTFANTDVNGDGKVNIFDVIRLLKYVTGEKLEVK